MLIVYKNDNHDEVNQKYNFKHLPFEIENLADLEAANTLSPQ